METTRFSENLVARLLYKIPPTENDRREGDFEKECKDYFARLARNCEDYLAPINVALGRGQTAVQVTATRDRIDITTDSDKWPTASAWVKAEGRVVTFRIHPANHPVVSGELRFERHDSTEVCLRDSLSAHEKWYSDTDLTNLIFETMLAE